MVGRPRPDKNTYQWSMPYARYSEVGPGYVKGKTLSPFQNALGERYQLVELFEGYSQVASGPWAFMGGGSVPKFGTYWERVA